MGRVIALIAALAWVGACGEDDRPETWSYIHAAVIVPNCTTSSCHNAYSAVAGVNLQDREGAYAILLGTTCELQQPGEATPNGNLVVPGSPETSRLMYLLLGDNVRRAMPPDRPLPDVDIELIERWIVNGAPCD